jgi:hypothetical protein
MTTEEPMDRERHTEEDATSVDEPTGRPVDQDLPYDPTMTEGDEANIPPESEADPEEDG